MPLALFHPLVQAWFKGRFERPTPAQALGWPAIAQGRHTLIAAPTGSGKTLAAFLTCIDRLVRSGLNGGLPERTEVVYVSPLKALSNDIQWNLAEPLAEMAALAKQAGTPFPEIRVAVRTGDTLASERQAMAKRPPHILITTP
ncbi:MAG: DEAD/DEAH box helicase, partial [Chloroflexi bacterium]|nr:DEAD/DEAH box helicase [Chloroflexota bacterium]